MKQVYMTGWRHHRWLTLIGLVCALFVSAPADAKKSAKLYQLLQDTEQFQKNVLNLEADLLQLEQDSAHPAKGRVSFYLNTALGGRFKVERLSLFLNGQPVAEHQYTAAQRRALFQGATQPLHVINLPPGNHKVQVRFVVREADKQHRGRAELAFEHGEAATWVELLIEDVPGEILATGDAEETTPPARRLQLTSHTWEAP